MQNLEAIIDYIKQFICYGDAKNASRIGYTADESAWSKFAVVIVPNGHLGRDIVYPSMKSIKPRLLESSAKHKTYIIGEDIIYNTFFFISRAEEILNPQRDEHGRFLAAYSILGRHNNLQIPLVDEYSRLVCKLIDLPLHKKGYNHIYLTHDIDVLTQYRHLRGALGGLYRGEYKKVFAAWQDINNDPAYTFPWLINEDKKVKNAEPIYFIKHTNGKGYDYPQYCLNGKDWKHTEQLLLNAGAHLGLHSGYHGSLPQSPYTLHRSHYLKCSIEKMAQLEKAGITDDFTIGFADKAGFRLQTTRAVRWINPKTMQLTNLILHPLTVMDCTLSNTNYMNLDEEEAFYYCQQLFDKVRMHHGELVLLWHNSIFTNDNYHRRLYPKILSIIND